MKRRLISGCLFLMVFAIFTWSLAHVDVQPIGPMESGVGYAKINEWVRERVQFSRKMYIITDWAGVGAILIAAGFAILGLKQWIQRRNILKVDKDILLLGVFYLAVFGMYVLFEFVVVNKRPILIDGVLEASYPSSTTVLSLCVLVTAGMQAKRRVRKAKIRRFLSFFLYEAAFFMVAGRLLSGVHWFTDVLGGYLFSMGAILLYSASVQSR